MSSLRRFLPQFPSKYLETIALLVPVYCIVIQKAYPTNFTNIIKSVFIDF